MTNLDGGRTWRERNLCTGCEHIGACRVGVRKWVEPDGSARGSVTFGPEVMGGAGVIHGGFAAVALDEICGMVPYGHGVELAVTRKLAVEYLKPTPIGIELQLKATLSRRDGRDFYVDGLLLMPSTDTLLVAADAIFREVSHDHYERHQTWLQEQRAEAVRGA